MEDIKEAQAMDSSPEVTQQNTEQPTFTQNHHDVNLIAMRKKLEAEEDARRLAERRAYELEQRLSSFQQPNQQVQAVEEDDINVDNEDYVQAKHIKTNNKKFSHKLSNTDKRIAELEQKLAYVEAKSATDSLKDFENIVTEDNMKTLARLYPDDFEALQSVGNLRVKSKTAYNMIKNYGIMGNRETRDAETRVNMNNQKPKLASSASPQTPQTPLTRLDDYGRMVLTENDRDRILAELERKKRGG